MKKQIHLIQFLPYFSPHIWGVEKVWEEISWKWTHWKSLIISGNICQQWNVYKKNIDNGVVYFFPCIEIVDNFILPRLWTSKFWKVWGELKKEVWEDAENYRVLTHTRFFLSSLMWGIFARRNDIRWIHLEHGSGYVKSWKKFIDMISYLFDRTIGKWIISKANTVLSISQSSKNFIEKEFKREWVQVFYRGIEIPKIQKEKTEEITFVYIGRLSRLKWVTDLVSSLKGIWNPWKLVIIGDGEERKNLEKQAEWWEIEFLWFKDRDFIMKFLSENKCILVNPSYQEWLPTTVIEGLATKNVVVATNVWGTGEISSQEDLILFEPWNTEKLWEKLTFAYKNFSELQRTSYKDIEKRFSREKSIETLYNFVK